MAASYPVHVSQVNPDSNVKGPGATEWNLAKGWSLYLSRNTCPEGDGVGPAAAAGGEVPRRYLPGLDQLDGAHSFSMKVA